MIRQYGALPYRLDGRDALEILLVTSRDSGRWVVPKGNPLAGYNGHETAAQEAIEEAGAEGEIGRQPIGQFRYLKTRRLLPSAHAEVLVYPLRVDRLRDEWPEAHERERQWFSREQAAEAVAEDELKRLILDFEP